MSTFNLKLREGVSCAAIYLFVSIFSRRGLRAALYAAWFSRRGHHVALVLSLRRAPCSVLFSPASRRSFLCRALRAVLFASHYLRPRFMQIFLRGAIFDALFAPHPSRHALRVEPFSPRSLRRASRAALSALCFFCRARFAAELGEFYQWFFVHKIIAINLKYQKAETR